MGASVSAAATAGNLAPRWKLYGGYASLDARVTADTAAAPSGRRVGLVPRSQLTLWSTFSTQVRISAITRLLSYSVTCAALIALRKSSDAPPALFKAPAGVALAIASLALAVWLLSNSTLLDARDTAIAAAIGMVIFFAYWLARRKAVSLT